MWSAHTTFHSRSDLLCGISSEVESTQTRRAGFGIATANTELELIIVMVFR